MLRFRDPDTDSYVLHSAAIRHAMQSMLEHGHDPAEMESIMARLSTEEEAREIFEEITGLEVFVR